MPKNGFTLIELLIVVAIIAILVLIAIPNFLQAQTRTKTAGVEAELNTLTNALEQYAVDHNTYPPTWAIRRLTTPISYISKKPVDEYRNDGRRDYTYYFRHANGPWWWLASWGPDMTWEALPDYGGFLRYDPTNGTISKGNIFRFGGETATKPPNLL